MFLPARCKLLPLQAFGRVQTRSVVQISSQKLLHSLQRRYSRFYHARRRFCEQSKKDVKTSETGGPSALSTFVVIKERTEEGLSILYVIGTLCLVLPGAIYLVGKSLFTTSGADNVRSKSFELIQEHSQCRHMLGEDMFARQTSHSVEYKDDDDHDRVTVIYEIKGNKTDARVDAEMKYVDGDWEWEFVILTTPYGTIYVIDNRQQYHSL